MKLLGYLKSRQALLRQVGEAAAQEERNRLARDLHDSIKQQLFSINVGVATVQERWDRDPEGARTALADVQRSAKEAMVEMQALLHQLRPEALTSTGLVEAVREQCEALGYRTGAEVTLELGEALTDDRLLPGTQEALFRIAQEALANVARHARARHVHVHLGRWGDGLGFPKEYRWAELKVEDDGQGFDPSVKASGMGLRSLRERTESLGGSLTVASKPGVGSRIEVYIPLVAPPTALEARIKGETLEGESSLWFTVMTVSAILPQRLTPAPGCTELFFMGFFFIFSVLSLPRERVILRRVSGVPLADVSRMFYLRHRASVWPFLFLGYRTFWYWRLAPGGWSGGRIVWGTAALLFATLAGFELIRFHRWSQFRAKWNAPVSKMDWLKRGLPLILSLWVFYNLRSSPEGLCLFGAVLVYFLVREPRMEQMDEQDPHRPG